MLRKSEPSKVVFSSILPVRKPLPNGLYGTKPIPSSSRVGTARYRESLLVPVLSTTGLLLITSLPLVLCWYLLRGLQHETADDEAVTCCSPGRACLVFDGWRAGVAKVILQLRRPPPPPAGGPIPPKLRAVDAAAGSWDVPEYASV